MSDSEKVDIRIECIRAAAKVCKAAFMAPDIEEGPLLKAAKEYLISVWADDACVGDEGENSKEDAEPPPAFTKGPSKPYIPCLRGKVGDYGEHP
jgi:hypothetical protein